MSFYSEQQKFFIAVECVVIGYDGDELKVLLSSRLSEAGLKEWRLVGSFLKEDQSADDTAKELATQVTGLNDVYMEQLHAFTDIGRRTSQRTISLTYFALLNMEDYVPKAGTDISYQWFSLKALPELLEDHIEIIHLAKERIKYRAAKQPLLFELLPARFTIFQLHTLYERVFDIEFDRRNIDRRLKQSNILVKLTEKDKSCSRKGAFYYRLSNKKPENFSEFGNIVPLKYHL